MKKLMSVLSLLAGLAFAQAQTTKPKEKEEVKKTSTPIEKVHNVFHPRHKHHNGYKVKRKTKHGRKYVKRVNTMEHTKTIKTKEAGSMDKKVTVTPTK
jgi:hypothetical protein